MKVLLLAKSSNFLRIFAGFLLGILFGAVVINILIGQHIDTMYQENQKLKTSLEEKKEQIRTLEEKINSSTRWLTVQEINVNVLLSLNDQIANSEAVKLILEKNCKSLLKELRGKRVKNIDPDLINSVLEDRIIVAEGYKFKLNVIWTLISEEVQIKIKANLIQQNQSNVDI